MRLLPVTLAFTLTAATLASAGVAAAAAANEIKIYRCAAHDGTVTVRDSPCLDGEVQQVRNMARPQDPPSPPADNRAAEPVYYQPAPSAYDSVSSGGGGYSGPVHRHPHPATAPAQPADWGHGSWVKGSWTDSGSWTDR